VLLVPPPDWVHHIRSVRFRRRLFGYRPREVHEHLHRVSGWFSMAGLDELLEERMREVAGEADRRRSEAETEATRVLAEARREADAIQRAAREEARAILEQAQRQAALERRGRSRLGRPVGARRDGR
jgi:DivIVA domain-containing protein